MMIMIIIIQGELLYSDDWKIYRVLQRKLAKFFHAVLKAKASLIGIVFILSFKKWCDFKNVS